MVILKLNLFRNLSSKNDVLSICFTRCEREDEGYVHLVCQILDLFLSHLEALGNMLVNQSRVKGKENVSPCYRRYCDYILIPFLSVDCGLTFSEKCGRMKLS